MKNKSKISTTKVTFSQIREILKSRTNCCKVKPSTLICTVTFPKQHHPYNLTIKVDRKDFYFIFSLTDDKQEFADLKSEITLFFDQFELPATSINKDRSSIKVEIPNTLAIEVIKCLDIFCPNDDEEELILDKDDEEDDLTIDNYIVI